MKKALRTFIITILCLLMSSPLSMVSYAAGGSMTIHAPHLGSTVGDCVIIESDGSVLVQDIGSDTSYPYIKAYLDKLGVKTIDLYFSHLHPDHTGSVGPNGGFAKILGDFNVRRLYIPDESIYTSNGLYADNISELYRFLFKRLSEKGYSEGCVVRLKKGSTFSFGSVSASVMGPVYTSKYTADTFKDNSSSGGDDKQHAYENNSSLITMFTCGATRYLTLGDTGDVQLKKLINEYGNKLDADILELSHHGRPEGSCSEKFLELVTPTYTFAQNCGEHCAIKTDSLGIKHRISETARKNAGKYGIVCTVGDQKESFIIDVSNDKTSIYTKEKKDANRLTGVFTLAGGDGVHYTTETFYLDANSNPVSGIVKLNGKTYLFENGKRIQGEYIHDTADKTKEMYWPFVNYGNQRRAFTKDGEMLIGFKKPFAENTDRYKSSKDEIFYFDKQGLSIAGDPKFSTLYKIGKSYYLISDTGKVFTGDTKVFTLTDGSTNSRYFKPDGAMRTGWYEKSGKKYYLKTSGKEIGFRTIGFTKIGSAYYYFYDAGNMAKDVWLQMKASGKKGLRYFGKDGKMVTGWLTLKGKTYYLKPSGKQIGFKTTGFTKIGSDYYLFYSGGNMAKNVWQQMKASGKKGNRYFGNDGKMLLGWQTLNGNKYYFMPDGKQVGFRATGLTKINKNTYYFTDGGKLVTNKTVTVKGYKYTLDKNGKVTKKTPAKKK